MIRNIISSQSKEIIVGDNTYLEFKSLTPMTITPNYTNTGITLQYSLNKVTWTNITAKAVTPKANVIYFRGRATGTKSLFTTVNASNAWLFTGATNLEVNGDITMLIQDSLGGMVRDIPLGSNAFTYMFYNCTNLVTAPTLPATTLDARCYNGMFRSCASLVTAPDLPATTLAASCYSNMFQSCAGLTTAPELPATKLADSCYSLMFFDCTRLVTVPALPATTLANFCYSSMFYNCSKIKISTTKVMSYINDYRVPTVGTGIVGINSLSDMFSSTGGTFKGTPTINTTYYTENTVV